MNATTSLQGRMTLSALPPAVAGDVPHRARDRGDVGIAPCDHIKNLCKKTAGGAEPLSYAPFIGGTPHQRLSLQKGGFGSSARRTATFDEFAQVTGENRKKLLT